LNRKTTITFFLFCYTVIFYGYALSQPDNDEKPNTDLEIELSCDKTEFIQGESIDVLVKITNNTNNTFRMRPPKHYIYDFNKDSTFTSQFGNGLIEIPPSGNYYYMLEPTSYLVFCGIDFSTHTLKPGNYEYYLSLFLGKEEFLSNKINIKVNPVPDSLVVAFNNLRYDPNEPYAIETHEEYAEKYIETYKGYIEMYKGTFYEQQYFFKLLVHPYFNSAIRNKDDAKDYREEAIKLNKEFILKYPNTSHAYGLFQVIMFNYTDNQALVEEILTSLKNNQPECKLLEVLRNQPGYLHKQLKHLLY